MGHQLPRISHVVPAAHPKLSAVGREVADLAALAGLNLDPWQAWVMDNALIQREQVFWNEFTERYENQWQHFEVGLVVSRQNGKGSILEARELAGLFVLGERLIIHSAHQFDTSKEAFHRILYLIENTPDLDQEVSRVSRSHGEEGIELRNGQRLRFRTRTKGGGRGFTGDCLILDEAMILNSDQVAALMPTLSARPNPQLWYTGSAGDKDASQLGRVRHRAIKGNDPRLFYAEWSIDGCNAFCPKGCTDHDLQRMPEDCPVERQEEAREKVLLSYAKSNPGLGIRISVEHIDAESRSMSEESFAMERLGVGDWPVEGDEWRVLGKSQWDSRKDEESQIIGDFVLAVDTTPNTEYSCIGVCGLNRNGMTHIEVTSDSEFDPLRPYDHRPGVRWVVPRVHEIWKTQKPLAVAIDKAHQAGAFIEELEDLGIKVISPLPREYAQACGELYSGVIPRKGNEPSLVHIGQPPLTQAVAGADKRELEGSWAWSKKLSVSDISPLVACTVALWGFKKMQLEPKPSAPWAMRM